MASGRMPCRTSSCRLRTRRGRVELGRREALIGVVLASSSTEAEQARAGISPSTTGYTAAKRCALAMIWSAALPASRSCPMCRGVAASSKFQLLTIHSSSRTTAIAAMIGGLAAIGNAVIDASRHCGVRDIPITAETIWRAL
jgi:hypothetical protein